MLTETYTDEHTNKKIKKQTNKQTHKHDQKTFKPSGLHVCLFVLGLNVSGRVYLLATNMINEFIFLNNLFNIVLKILIKSSFKK